MAAAGVKLVGEIGLGSVKTGKDARRWCAGRRGTA